MQGAIDLEMRAFDEAMAALDSDDDEVVGAPIDSYGIALPVPIAVIDEQPEVVVPIAVIDEQPVVVVLIEPVEQPVELTVEQPVVVVPIAVIIEQPSRSRADRAD